MGSFVITNNIETVKHGLEDYFKFGCRHYSYGISDEVLEKEKNRVFKIIDENIDRFTTILDLFFQFRYREYMENNSTEEEKACVHRVEDLGVFILGIIYQDINFGPVINYLLYNNIIDRSWRLDKFKGLEPYGGW